MDAWLSARLGHIVAWFPWVCAAIVIASAIGIVSAGRWRRQTTRRFTALTTSIAAWMLFASGTGALAYVSFGPHAPAFQSAGRMEARLGRRVPDMSFTRVSDDVPDRLSRLGGRVVVVNLWATWCGPCDWEMPELNRLQRDYHARGLTVLTLSDEPREDIARYVATRAPDTLNGYVDNFGWLTTEKFRARPFTMIIDRTGVLREFVLGAQDYEAFERSVLPYLN